MEKIICKSCGAPNEVEAQSGSWFCEYCGNPIEMGPERAKFKALFSKADDAWDRKDFDDALKLYEQIVAQDNTQAEAHWSAALCRYGVAYVVDPLRGNKMPTCNRINRTSILDDKNYLAAIRHASPKNKESYERLAGEIERISTRFLRIVDQETPYDVFISYKKTGENGRATLDSEYARKLYYYLTDKGLKVFFAEESLMDKAGHMYEPYIFAALTSAKVMVLMGSCREYFEAVWVKNEWQRFLTLAEEDLTKGLIPVCIRCKPEDALPMGLSQMQALDGDDFAFLERVYDIIKRKMGAAPPPKPGTGRDVLAEMAERYATAENVARVLEVLDCEEKDAIETLIVKKGDIKATINSIGLDPDYKKVSWNCTECSTRNTHDVCRKCGITHADVIKLTKMREDAQRREAEQKRREEEAIRKEQQRQEEARRKEYERSEAAKQARAAEKRRRAQRRQAAFKKFVRTVVVLAILAGIGYGGYLIYENAIKPALWENEETDVLYTPELLQTYVGTYSTWRTSGQVAITFTECSEDGELKGYTEFLVGVVYGKYEISATITSKKNSGKLFLTVEPGAWIHRPDHYDPLDSFEVTVNDDYTTFFCSEYNMDLEPDADYADADSLNTPQLLQSYSVVDDQGIENILTIYTCTEDGRVTASWEWFTDRGYSRVNMDGYIAVKKVGGKGVIVWTNQEEETIADGSSWEDATYSLFEADCTTLLCDDELLFAAGVSDKHFIRTADDLNKLSNNNGYYVLQNDIDMTGVDWTPIEGFGGVLDGNGYTIRNLTINVDRDNVGLFATLNGQVKNLSFDNASVTVSGRRENVGILCGTLSGGVSNVKTHGTVHAKTSTNVGGIAGKVLVTPTEFTMKNVENEANVSGLDNVGGIFGYFKNNRDYATTTNTFANMINSGLVAADGNCAGGLIGKIDASEEYIYLLDSSSIGSVSGVYYVGGLVGYGMGTYTYKQAEAADSYMQDCYCSAGVQGKAYVGGLAGYLKGILVKECSNNGTVIDATGYLLEDGNKNAYVGGIAGYGTFAESCVNDAAINYTAGGNYVGGIFGYVNPYRRDLYMSGLQNNGNISGANYVGGLFGFYTNPGNYDDTKNQFDNCVNRGIINGSGDYVGGIAGKMNTSGEYLYFSGMVNQGNVTGSMYVGGLTGHCEGIYTYKQAETTDSYIQDSSCCAAITGKAYVGCIAGYAKNVMITDCANEGSTLTATGYALVDGNKNAYVGGFVGYGSFANNCVNKVDIDYTAGGNYVGGIIGYVSISRKNVSITGLENTANIRGASYVGGIFGYYANPGSYDDTINQIDGCKNSGNVTGSGDYVGGLFGIADLSSEYLYITGCENTGTIKGNSYVGGLCGSAKGKSGSYIDDCIVTGSVSASTSKKGPNAGELVNVTVE